MKINWFKHLSFESISTFVENIILYGNALQLSDLLIYLKQGYWCKDCDKESYDCICELNCEICKKLKIPMCMCEIGFLRNEIRNFGVNFCKYNLSKKAIDKLIIHIEYRAAREAYSRINGYVEYLDKLKDLL